MTTILSKHLTCIHHDMFMSKKTHVLQRINLSLSCYLPEDFHKLWPKRLRAESTPRKLAETTHLPRPKRPIPKIGRNDPGRNDPGPKRPGFMTNWCMHLRLRITASTSFLRACLLIAVKVVPTKTCPCNVYSIEPNFYIAKLGQGYTYFSYFCSKT